MDFPVAAVFINKHFNSPPIPTLLFVCQRFLWRRNLELRKFINKPSIKFHNRCDPCVLKLNTFSGHCLLSEDWSTLGFNRRNRYRNLACVCDKLWRKRHGPTLSERWQCVRPQEFNNSSCSEDRHVEFCPCYGSLRYSLKLSRINAISGDIVCTQSHSAWTEKNAACPCGVPTKCSRRGNWRACHWTCKGPTPFRHIASELSKSLFTVATDPSVAQGASSQEAKKPIYESLRTSFKCTIGRR